MRLSGDVAISVLRMGEGLPVNRVLGLALIASVLQAGTAGAQQQEVPPTAVDDVVVTGRSLSETANAFVTEVTRPPPGHGPARWLGPVCVGVVNLGPTAAQVVIDRITDVALSLDLQPQGPGCDPNIVVIASDDAGALATALIAEHPKAFRPNYSGASQSRGQLEAFRTSSAPVRWWNVSLPVTPDGTPAVRVAGGGGPVIEGGSLLISAVSNRMLKSFIILDIPKMQGVNFQQVGDFVAMVSLAQMNPNADTAHFGTILNLFKDPSQTPQMTDWDRNYLRALYSAHLNQRQPNARLGAVGSRMVRVVRADDRASGTD